MNEYEYPVTDNGLLDLSWPDELDEFRHQVIQALRRRVEISGDSGRLWSRTLEIAPSSSNLEGRLRLEQTHDGVLAKVVGAAPLGDEALTQWWVAVEEAASAIGQQHESFDWVCLVGEGRSWLTPGQSVARDARTAEMIIEPMRLALIEEFPDKFSLSSSSTNTSWPAAVSGTSTGYDLDSAMMKARAKIRVLCALLSLAWGRAWVLREGPHAVEHGHSVDSLRATIARISTGTHAGTPEPVAVPEWVGSVMELLGQEKTATDAVLTYHEGLLMSRDHPSFAFVAFIGSIEAVGKCVQAEGGARQNFSRALRLVLPDEQVRVVGQEYDLRSSTTHAGVLHGWERSFGFPAISLGDWADLRSPGRFASQGLLAIQEVARRVLLQSLLTAAGAAKRLADS